MPYMCSDNWLNFGRGIHAQEQIYQELCGHFGATAGSGQRGNHDG